MVATEGHLPRLRMPRADDPFRPSDGECHGHPAGMSPRTLLRRRVVSAWRRLLHEEDGVALMLALVSMLVLTITLSTVMFMTAAGARDAHRSNAGQKASALAESGINNALAVLNANYPGHRSTRATRSSAHADDALPHRKRDLVGNARQRPDQPDWKWQWQLTAIGRVKNPTGPAAADVVRKSDRRRAGRHPGQHVRGSGHHGHRLDLRAQ